MPAAGFRRPARDPNPRLMRRKDAAVYCGLSVRDFNSWVARGLLPAPIEGTNRWDRKAIDLYLDRVSGLVSTNGNGEADPFQPWRVTENARPA
ncbi:hypothetical protein SAMN05444161_7543 [Rhizobiales bacterium GAS191]|nr:hypothetical protein SAMN05444161_7543 [Rhizobiales bacterium GAS191]